MGLLITGGAGFIGFHAARYFAGKGEHVTILDNFSRYGGREHVQTLTQQFPELIDVVEMDIRAPWSDISARLIEVMNQATSVLHLAGQVAVTSSVLNPRDDFEVNALGTLNILEAARLSNTRPKLIYASSNKVYGAMADQEILERDERYYYATLPYGISEAQNLDFHSPYGCSKGTADQYVRDYARMFDLPTVVLRQSCIYGTDQYGHEDQGWIAHIALNALRHKTIRIFGDGKQVRDVLYVDDLVNLYDQCFQKVAHIKGDIFNVGGGHKNILSLRDLVHMLETQLNRKCEVSYQDWRPGDQRVYISDIQKLKDRLDWEPQVNPETGVDKFIEWARENLEHIEKVIAQAPKQETF